ncbi:sodium:calcium antiporter [Pararhizobium mangrovi]|uniref:Sodium:calcium antiporter n=1 Tax=Pararhizobium mangrovi TaxID=2590452 RepID=A0A506UI29_9HYPH|nr:sodium:calcium antiporter [Pararhizobium mangrovi]
MLSAESALWLQFAVFAVATVVILVAGSKMSFLADRIADQTGFGEALTGAVLLGAATSLPGVITSAWTAYNGYASLAYSNAIGGIAVQSLFLVVADFFYRRANLEHAGADISNIINGSVLIALLGIMLAASLGPDITVFAIHPASILIFVGYVYGLSLAQSSSVDPMWRVTPTHETKEDEPDDEAKHTPLKRTIPGFLLCLVLVGIAGFAVAQIGTTFVSSLDVSQGLVGTLLTSTVTSLPELVTAIAAVRAGSPQLAVGGIIGGNAFDTLFAGVADIAYRNGSIYHAITDGERFLTAIVIAMTAIFVLGMLQRERRNIGFEGWIVAALYVIAVASLVTMG